MTIQATAIYRRTSKTTGLPGNTAFGMTEVKADDKAAAIARAEKVGKRLGNLFAVAWDLVETPEGEEAPRRVRTVDGLEMSWSEFLARFGAEIGLL